MVFSVICHHLGRNPGFGLNAMKLEQHLLDAPSLMIFGGLDEVTDPKAREDVSAAITSFARRFQRSRVIVTSRVIGFDSRPFFQHASGFKPATLDDFDRKQIERFSDTWFKLTFRSDRERAAQRVERRA